jgi:formamidopyrimidine-DNA glycosylase
MYIHDILFRAGLHPLQPASSLSSTQFQALTKAIHHEFQRSLAKGGSLWEKDLYGRPGGFDLDDMYIAYHEDDPCPVCGTPVSKIRTGSNHSYICPTCQEMPGERP